MRLQKNGYGITAFILTLGLALFPSSEMSQLFHHPHVSSTPHTVSGHPHSPTLSRDPRTARGGTARVGVLLSKPQCSAPRGREPRRREPRLLLPLANNARLHPPSSSSPSSPTCFEKPLTGSSHTSAFFHLPHIL